MDSASAVAVGIVIFGLIAIGTVAVEIMLQEREKRGGDVDTQSYMRELRRERYR